MNTYTLTAYLDDVKVDHPVDYLVVQANRWFGDHNWNRLELTEREAAE